jgi:hypothetical protein
MISNASTYNEGIKCSIPAYDNYKTVMVQISNDKQNWCNTTEFYYTDDRKSCDKNMEFNDYTCIPCGFGYYKPVRSSSSCIKCKSGGYCMGGQDPIPDDGYYGQANDNKFSACLPSVACKRGNVCVRGYKGERCSSCSSLPPAS